MIVKEETKRSLERIDLFNGGCYLFQGASGLGKHEMALEIAAKALRVDDASTSPDFYHIQAMESVIGIDDIQPMLDFRRVQSANGTVKVIVVDNADTMTEAAQNAILKLLEDGLDNCICILVAHSDLIDTIQSRSKSVVFNPLEDGDFKRFTSSFGNTGEHSELLCQLAGNRPGFFLRLLEDKEYVSKVAEILEALESEDKKRIFSSLSLLKEKDRKNFYETYSYEYVLSFFNVLLDFYMAKAMEGDRNGISYMERVLSDRKNMRSGNYNKNDFFDLFRYLAK